MNRLSSHQLPAILLVVCVFAVALSSVAQVHPKLQAAIFIKLLNYDMSLARKPQNVIKFHIVIDSATASQQNALQKEFSVISNQKISGKRVEVVTSDIKTLVSDTSLDQGAAHIYYLPDGSSVKTLKTVLTSAKPWKIAVLGGNSQLVEAGAAVGISLDNGKPQIIVNLKQSRAQGMNLSSQLLKLAKVI
ncbi:MAG: YfiR family protein [Deltaproteobacteria bacterium]|nr:YfiR family protein [Deltaproteobacteria bacterium]